MQIILFKSPKSKAITGFAFRFFESLSYDFSNSSIMAKAVFLAENVFCPIINVCCDHCQ